MYSSSDINDIIHQYLSGQMTQDEKVAFEQELAQDKTLQGRLKVAQAASVALKEHKLMHIHDLLQEERKAKKLKAKSRTAILIGLIGVLGTATVYYFNQTNPERIEPQKSPAVNSLPSHTDTPQEKVISSDNAIKDKRPVLKEQKEPKHIEESDDLSPKTIVDKSEVAPPSHSNGPTLVQEKATQGPVEQKPVNNHKSTGSVSLEKEVNCKNVLITASWQTTKACDGDGVIQVIDLKGGLEPYTLQLNDGVSQSHTRFINLSEGKYTLTITDKYQCQTKYQNIKVEKGECYLNYDINTTRAEIWHGPEVQLPSNLTIFDKSGILVYRAELNAGQKAEWDARDLNNNLKFGYFEFVIQNVNNEVIKGSITVTE
jgi:hypothetical protein